MSRKFINEGTTEVAETRQIELSGVPLQSLDGTQLEGVEIGAGDTEKKQMIGSTMTAAKLPQLDNRIEELFTRADQGDREALRSLLDLRAKGNQDAFDAVMELNRREAERMARLFA